MGGNAAAPIPGPIDYSAAMTANSNNQMMTQMSQIGASMIAMQLASMNRSEQISANLEMNLERNDAKIEIAQMNYQMASRAEQNRHAEAMGEIDNHRLEISRGPETSTSDFLG